MFSSTTPIFLCLAIAGYANSQVLSAIDSLAFSVLSAEELPLSTSSLEDPFVITIVPTITSTEQGGETTTVDHLSLASPAQNEESTTIHSSTSTPLDITTTISRIIDASPTSSLPFITSVTQTSTITNPKVTSNVTATAQPDRLPIPLIIGIVIAVFVPLVVLTAIGIAIGSAFGWITRGTPSENPFPEEYSSPPLHSVQSGGLGKQIEESEELDQAAHYNMAGIGARPDTTRFEKFSVVFEPTTKVQTPSRLDF